MLTKFKNQDWLITIILGIFAFISLILIFSTTFDAQNLQQGQGTIYRQILFLIIGFSVYFFITTIDLSWLKQKNIIILIYLIILASLVFVIFFGQTRANTQRWIFLGPLSFQPAEFAKISLVIVTSYLLCLTEEIASVKTKLSKWYQNPLFRRIGLSVGLALIYAILIYLQPSLGNALILLLTWSSLIFLVVPFSYKSILAISIGIVGVAGYYKLSVFQKIAQLSYLSDTEWKIFIIFSLGIIFFSLFKLFKINKLLLISIFLLVIMLTPLAEFGWTHVIKDYHRQRIISYIQGSTQDPLNKGYQVRQSVIAIGSGRITGRGYLQGSQSSLKVLPFAHTDFIFAALAEQFGFVGVMLMFILYGLLGYRIYRVFLISTDQFSKLLTLGSLSILIINLFVNTAMNMGLIPVTGVPLPLISYGGSSVLVIMISMGLVQMAYISIKPQDYSKKLVWKLERTQN